VPPARARQDAPTVLVVDDDPQALKLSERALRELGYHPVCRSDVEGGLQAAAEQLPVAVVLDLVMPELGGFEFLQRFRRTELGRRTPVIIWTVKDLTREERDHLRVAAQAVVAKSTGVDALTDELRSYLRSDET
jgi:DNA-binding response OmpR family regulator